MLQGPLGGCELHLVIDAERFLGIADDYANYVDLVGNSKLYDVRQIVLTLGIAPIDAFDPVAQAAGRGCHQPRIDLGNFELVVGCICLLNNADNAAVEPAPDPPIACRVIEICRQQ